MADGDELDGPASRFRPFSEQGIPWSGDADFMDWQRRKRTLTPRFALASFLLPGATIAGWLMWKLTGSPRIAVGVFALGIGFFVALLIREKYWQLTGR